VVSTGPGAKHALIGCLNFSWYDAKRNQTRYKQAGRGGIGTVFADKGIKAIVVRWNTVTVDTNNPADKSALKEVARMHSREIVELDPKQNEMSKIGTTHLVTIMNDHDLLPTNNFRYGRHPEAGNLGQEVYRHIFDKGFDGCWMGCTLHAHTASRISCPSQGLTGEGKFLLTGQSMKPLRVVDQIWEFSIHILLSK